MTKIEDQFTTPAAIEDEQGLNLFLTGAPGSGKTAFVGSAADIYPNQVLLLDINGGNLTLRDRSDITLLVVDKWKAISEAYEFLAQSEHQFAVVAIDLVTEAYNLCLEQVKIEGKVTSGGQPTLEGYGIANTRFIEMVRNYRLLATKLGIHVIFTGHSTETKDESSGMIIVRTKLTPGTLSSVLGTVDVAGYLEIKRKKRLMQLQSTSRVWAKIRRPLSFGPVPDTIENPTFEMLLNIVQGGNIEE